MPRINCYDPGDLIDEDDGEPMPLDMEERR